MLLGQILNAAFDWLRARGVGLWTAYAVLWLLPPLLWWWLCWVWFGWFIATVVFAVLLVIWGFMLLAVALSDT